jgi:hypothetical protein
VPTQTHPITHHAPRPVDNCLPNNNNNGNSSVWPGVDWQQQQQQVVPSNNHYMQDWRQVFLNFKILKLKMFLKVSITPATNAPHYPITHVQLVSPHPQQQRHTQFGQIDMLRNSNCNSLGKSGSAFKRA